MSPYFNFWKMCYINKWVTIDMDLEKEVTVNETCMVMELTKRDIKETNKRIEISAY